VGYQNAKYKMKIKQSLILGLALSVALSSSVAQPMQGQNGGFSNWSTGTKIGAVVLGIGAVAVCAKWFWNKFESDKRKLELANAKKRL